MAKNPKQTGKDAATKASDLLRKSKSETVKTVAGSDLSQAPYKKPKPKR